MPGALNFFFFISPPLAKRGMKPYLKKINLFIFLPNIFWKKGMYLVGLCKENHFCDAGESPVKPLFVQSTF